MTRWVADSRTRRVPNFVKEMTGDLDTKRKIVAKFGQNAEFEKGEPVPAAKVAGLEKATAPQQAPRSVKAKHP